MVPEQVQYIKSNIIGRHSVKQQVHTWEIKLYKYIRIKQYNIQSNIMGRHSVKQVQVKIR